MSHSQRCLVLGSINCDEVLHLPHIVRPGETISSTSMTRYPGGKGANQAYAVAMAGGDVDIHGCIGEDGVWLRDVLELAHIGVQGLRTVENEVTGRAIILLAKDGENSIVNEGELDDLVSACAGTSTIPTDRGRGHSSILSLHRAEGFEDIGIICTQGGSGMLYFHPIHTAGQVRALPAAQLEKPLVDTTGAGDCFAGTFVAGLMRAEELEDILGICLAACAACVEAPGAIASYASWEEIKRRAGR